MNCPKEHCTTFIIDKYNCKDGENYCTEVDGEDVKIKCITNLGHVGVSFNDMDGNPIVPDVICILITEI